MGARSRAVARRAAQESREASAAWRASFRSWSHRCLKAAKAALQAPAGCACSTAEDMRADWAEVWAPSGGSDASRRGAWLRLAEEAGCEDAPQQEWQAPSVDEFAATLRGQGGAAGLDGWEASELRGLLTWAPWAIGELHGLLVRTTEAAAAGGIPAAVRDRLHAWRIVGIPKRLSEQLRPIAVGSCITRAWHRTLAGPPLGQWCGRKGVSVVAATASWLSAPAVAVA